MVGKGMRRLEWKNAIWLWGLIAVLLSVDMYSAISAGLFLIIEIRNLIPSLPEIMGYQFWLSVSGKYTFLITVHPTNILSCGKISREL